MKKALVVFAVLMVMALVFTGCDKAGDTVAIFTAEGGYTLTCYKNGTWVCHVNDSQNGMEADMDMAKGTYTGNPAEDGACTVTKTHEIDEGAWMSAIIMNTPKITNAEVPLVALDTPETETINIANGSFAFDEDTYTRR